MRDALVSARTLARGSFSEQSPAGRVPLYRESIADRPRMSAMRRHSRGLIWLNARRAIPAILAAISSSRISGARHDLIPFSGVPEGASRSGPKTGAGKQRVREK
jgi:hypothetical protein